MGALHALQLAVLAWLATATTAGMWPKELTEAQAQAFGSTWDLLFTATPVSFLGSSSSRQAFYYNNVTLAAQGPVYMIQAAWNTSLCLSLSSSSPMETDIPMVFQPCALLDSWGTPPLEALQSFKLIKRCGVNEWVLQQWTGREVESTDITGFVTTHPLEGTWMCVAWDAASGTVTQQVCTNSNSTAQRWVMSQTLEATQSLCPPVSASTFLASSPADVLQSMHNFLGCPPSVISAWAAASPIVTRGQASTLPSCFNIQLLQVMFYDGVITQGMLSFGKRDPEYLPASPMGASTLVDLMLGPSAVWGSNGQWPLGTPLMAWFRAVDVVMLTNSTMLQSAPVLVPATTTTPSSLAAPPLLIPLYPWSLLSSVDSLVVTCTPAAAHGLGGPLPGTLLSVFAMGLRSLSMRQCGVSGTLPEAWATAGGVAARQYVHIYPVLMDFSSNKLTGDIPSIWMDGWLDCFVSQMDLSHNQMNVTLTDRQLQSTCAGGSGGAYSMCSYFKTSLESDVPAFRQHVNYFKGPVDETECGVVTQGLGFSGKSWNHNALARAFVYAWEFDFITNNPCQAGVTCDLDVSSYTFQVKRADAAPVPYSLILDGNPIIGIPDSWTADGKAWFAWAPCDKRITFADLVHNSCVAFSPSPYLEITWSLIAAALVICSFIGWYIRQRGLQADERARILREATAPDLRRISRKELSCVSASPLLVGVWAQRFDDFSQHRLASLEPSTSLFPQPQAGLTQPCCIKTSLACSALNRTGTGSILGENKGSPSRLNHSSSAQSDVPLLAFMKSSPRPGGSSDEEGGQQCIFSRDEKSEVEPSPVLSGHWERNNASKVVKMSPRVSATALGGEEGMIRTETEQTDTPRGPGCQGLAGLHQRSSSADIAGSARGAAIATWPPRQGFPGGGPVGEGLDVAYDWAAGGPAGGASTPATGTQGPAQKTRGPAWLRPPPSAACAITPGSPAISARGRVAAESSTNSCSHPTVNGPLGMDEPGRGEVGSLQAQVHNLWAADISPAGPVKKLFSDAPDEGPGAEKALLRTASGRLAARRPAAVPSTSRLGSSPSRGRPSSPHATSRLALPAPQATAQLSRSTPTRPSIWSPRLIPLSPLTTPPVLEQVSPQRVTLPSAFISSFAHILPPSQLLRFPSSAKIVCADLVAPSAVDPPLAQGSADPRDPNINCARTLSPRVPAVVSTRSVTMSLLGLQASEDVAFRRPSLMHSGAVVPMVDCDGGSKVADGLCSTPTQSSPFSKAGRVQFDMVDGDSHVFDMVLPPRATSAIGDWMGRHRFRIKFMIQTGLYIYITVWSAMLIGQAAAQSKLCDATDLCPTYMFTLVVICTALPGWTTAFVLIILGTVYLGRHNRWSATRHALAQMVMIPVGAVLGAVLSGPIWIIGIVGWCFIGFRWMDEKYWILLCVMSCCSMLVSAMPMAIVVTKLYVTGVELSASHATFHSKTALFMFNMVGHAVAISTWCLGMNLRRDAWSVLHKLYVGDCNWHVYPEQQAAAHYAFCYPKRGCDGCCGCCCPCCRDGAAGQESCSAKCFPDDLGMSDGKEWITPGVEIMGRADEAEEGPLGRQLR